MNAPAPSSPTSARDATDVFISLNYGSRTSSYAIDAYLLESAVKVTMPFSSLRRTCALARFFAADLFASLGEVRVSAACAVPFRIADDGSKATAGGNFNSNLENRGTPSLPGKRMVLFFFPQVHRRNTAWIPEALAAPFRNQLSLRKRFSRKRRNAISRS